MRQLDLPRLAPRAGDVAFHVKLDHLVHVTLRHQQVLAHHLNAKGIAEPRPDRHEFPVGLKDLNPLVAAVADIDAVAAVDGDRVGKLKLARRGALLAPFGQPLPAGRKANDAAVTGVGDKDLAARAENQIVRRAKVFLVRAGDIEFAQGQQQLAPPGVNLRIT